MNLLAWYQRVRRQSVQLCDNLSPEDMTAQSMPDASPSKWHLAHTTWFFETFILLERDFKAFNPQFQYLFNSYYNSKGRQYRRPQRGLITRPTVDEILEYRAYVDEQMASLLDNTSVGSAGGDLHIADPSTANLNATNLNTLVEVGLHHEMQHQELLLTDILHLFSLNPLYPSVVGSELVNSERSSHKHSLRQPLQWLSHGEALVEVGAAPQQGFAYDCESPRYQTWLTAFALASRLITNGEWLEFVADGGYQEPLLWLSDGWTCKQQNEWQAPAYWEQQDGRWMQFGLDGLRELDLSVPVCHISYYEAQAYAQWAGKRLPREHELEFVSEQQSIVGNFLESSLWRPQAAPALEERQDGRQQVQQLYGDVWEWTQSAYLPYPGFKAEQGALGEYNGKFMCGQFVLRGGSCVTPTEQMRPSYRNFFYPWQRWQFTGLRLAQDL